MLGRILNLLGWVGTALVVAAVVVFFAKPEWNRYAVYLAWTGLVLVLLYPIVNWREIASQFGRRQSRYAAIASTSVVVVLGILFAVNYLSARNSKRWDLTANSVNSLSEQSLKVLSELKGPVKLILLDRKLNFDQYRERMNIYDSASQQVSVEYVDAEADPVRAKSYGIEAVPTIIVDYMGKTEKVTTVDEREITSAIIRAITGEQRKMYFLQGHGEKDPAEGEPSSSYSGVVQFLKADNVVVEPLSLSQHQEVPEDATVVGIIGPSTDPLDDEIEKLKRYLTRGGKLLLAMDPTVGEGAQQMPKLIALAREWGIEIGNDVVLDVSGQTTNPTIAVSALPYPTHPITDGFRVVSLYPLARSVTPVSPAPEGKTVQPLVQTSDAAWAETDIKGLVDQKAQPEMNEGTGDKAGPVGIAATVTTAAPPAPDPSKPEEKPATPQTRIAVFGDSDFASNAVAGNLRNADLFLNTVNWLTAQENLIAIRPREPRDSRLEVTQPVVRNIGIFSILVLPAIVMGAGIYSWSRRRRS
jgi:ABC-type uncharacterized transport system involved in gliding motility auxiliary subunit